MTVYQGISRWSIFGTMKSQITQSGPRIKKKKTGIDFIQDSKRMFTNQSLMCGQGTTIYSNYHEHYKINFLNVV